MAAVAAAAGAVPAQEAPPPAPAPAPSDTAAPGDSLRTSFLPTANLSVFTNGNTNVVGEEESAVGASVGITLPVTWVRRLSTWAASYSTGAQVYGEDHSDADDLSHNLSASYNRTLSRRSTWGLNLSGSFSEQQGFNAERPDEVVTLVPRTGVMRLSGGVHTNLATGQRSYVDLSLRGGLNRYDDLPPGGLEQSEDTNGNLILDPGEDLDNDGVLDFASVPISFVDSVHYGGHVGWGMTVSERTTIGVGYGYGQIVYEDAPPVTNPGEDLNGNGILDPGEDLNGNGLLDLGPTTFPARDTDVHTLYGNGTRRFSEFTTGSLQLGVLSAQQEGSEDRVEPSLSASMTRQVSEQSSLAFGVRQSAGVGHGNGVATLDRGLYGSWAWGMPRISVGVSLSYWDRETLIDPLGGIQDERTSTFQISENFGWTPGQRFSYGVFHAFRDQKADDPTLETKGYHSGGFFVRWNIRGRSARVG